MPLYDFECMNAECMHTFEAHLPLSKLDTGGNPTESVECPQCGKTFTRKLITNPAHYKHVSWSKWRAGMGK